VQRWAWAGNEIDVHNKIAINLVGTINHRQLKEILLSLTLLLSFVSLLMSFKVLKKQFVIKFD
jgi:hypothetical protein